MKHSFPLLAACILAAPLASVAQEIVAPYAPQPTRQSPTVAISPIPPGTVPVTVTADPNAPQPPGTAITYVPAGTPLITTPDTSLGYAPTSASASAANMPIHNSMVTNLADGTKIEIDSDNSVYQLFADGARTTETDGMHRLMDGSTITIKNGKKIP